MEDQTTLLTISQAAKRLGVSPGTVRTYADKGMIPVIKLPSGHRRFRPEDVQDLRREMGLEPSGDEEQATP